MSNFIVRIDHLNDIQLESYGWICTYVGAEFSIYWSVRYGEEQPISNDPPRYIIIYDVNEAMWMTAENKLIAGPSSRK